MPKDTKQLRATYEDIPNKLITAIVESNRIRKNFIANQIIALKPHKVGIYRLNMKSDSDNCRQSAILDIIEQLKKEKIECTLSHGPTSHLSKPNWPGFDWRILRGKVRPKLWGWPRNIEEISGSCEHKMRIYS